MIHCDGRKHESIQAGNKAKIKQEAHKAPSDTTKFKPISFTRLMATLTAAMEPFQEMIRSIARTWFLATYHHGKSQHDHSRYSSTNQKGPP